ncbi:MAG TPA: sulfatase [Chloroflexota bacterium]|nr:sulfatase [Chloroflexota bacterium]
MTESQPARRPNVIWIMADQMRAHATGYAGDPNVHTPNLDRLAAEGFVFTNAVAGTPLCCPFRGAMVTGRYPHNSGVPGHRYPMPAETRTIAHEFRDAGYRTCYIGKWHLDGDRPELGLVDERSARTRVIPPERRGGFQDWWAYENNNRPFDCLIHTDYSGKMRQFRLPGYETDCLTDILISWLGDRSGAAEQQGAEYEPFFAVLSVQPPHNPYTAPEETMARYTPGQMQLRANVPPIPAVQEQARRDLAGYYAAIERLDWNIGRLRRTLDEMGIAGETYLVFFSDHGDMHGSHGQWRKTAPWEEAIRIPFIIGGPSREHQQSYRTSMPINHVDIAPTTLGLCGLEPPRSMEGTNYAPALQRNATGPGETDLPDSAYISLPVPTGHGDSIDREWRGVVTRDGWKYACLEGQPWLLFDLNEDPYELVNLVHNSRHRNKRKQLHGRLARWIEETGDSFRLPVLTP